MSRLRSSWSHPMAYLRPFDALLRLLPRARQNLRRGESGGFPLFFVVIQPVGDLVRVITPLATHSVCWNTPRTSPFPQRHWMHVDQFA